MFNRFQYLIRKGISEPHRIAPFLRGKVTWFSYFLGDGSWAPLPVSIKLYVNAKCNAQCRMCDIGQNKRDSMFYKQSLKEGGNISIDLIDKLLDEVGAYFPEINFAGVEPLLHPDIIQVMERVKKQRLFLSLTTNGLLLEHFADKLLRTGLDVITGNSLVHL